MLNLSELSLTGYFVGTLRTDEVRTAAVASSSPPTLLGQAAWPQDAVCHCERSFQLSFILNGPGPPSG